MSALKKIEEKHWYGVTARGLECSVCNAEAPCDVVKLARALDHAKIVFASCHGYEEEARACARTLEEVAGE